MKSMKQTFTVGRVAVFVALSAVIVTMASERVYWYWAGLNVGSVIEISLFYVIPVSGALWALAHAKATRVHQVVLAGAFFAFLVEGVLTPVIYQDGPLPIMAAMFVGWHGILAFVGFWYLTRRWLLERRTLLTAIAATAFGVLWGIWAIVSAVGDTTDIEGGATVLEPSQFALYAIGVGATLAAAHWLIGFVWPTSWRPSRASTIIVGVVNAAYMAVAVILFVPWAPAKLALLLGGTYWLMTKGRDTNHDEPRILDRLAGRIRARDAAVLLLMPLTAAATYGAIWAIGISAAVSAAVYWALILAQILGGGAAYIWATRRALTTQRQTSNDTELVTSSG
ncbi:MAG: hypothetical protein BMS9Abin17_1496 [Acidimicrobiia bacterium]|nr:MAG: hypothetical protein BMS9Abin17_1496 [Acidimicrobiia bacterium]